MSEAEDSKRYGEYVQDSTASADRSRLKTQIHEAIEEANKKVARGAVAEAGGVLRDVIIPALREFEFAKPIPQYHSDIHHADDLPWHWHELKLFLDNPNRWISDAAAESTGSSDLAVEATGNKPLAKAGTDVIRRALASVESISTQLEITAKEMRHEVDVNGFSGKIGTWLRDPEKMHDVGDSVDAVTRESGALKSLFLGGTGQGKSTGLEAEVEDFYQRNFRDDAEPVKVLDLAGMRDGENWFYDIPQQQPKLKRIRREMDLPETFEDSEECGEPDLEILMPLSPGLENEDLPYDTEAEEFVVKPFVVPASGIPKTLMIKFIESRLSDGQEEAVRSTYEAVDREKDDWALRDLAEEVRDREELSERDRATAVNVLRSLQDTGFIRTNEHEYTIDWDEIFNTPETITVFSQAKCENQISKYITFAYLLHTAVEERKDMIGVPEVVVVTRELWKVAPHKQRQSPFNEVAALQEGIAETFTEVFRENRHSGIHLVADTQQPSDLEKAVREMFNRYVIYTTDKDTLKDIFSWTSNWRYQSFWQTMSAKAGEAGIVGQIQPAIDNRDIEFISPVRYAPPSHHHRVTPGDDVAIKPDLTGWHGRCRHLDREELRQPAAVEGIDWDVTIPEELDIAPATSPDDQPADPKRSPVVAFVERCARPASLSSYTKKSDLYDAFNELLRKHHQDRWDFNERSVQTKFAKRFKSAFPEDVENRRREGEYAFVGVELTRKGHELLKNARNEVQDAAEPIRTGD